jgi:hypothetical protein
MYANMRGKQTFALDGIYGSINMSELPSAMDVEIFLDIGENSNATLISKLSKVGAEILPSLNQQGAGMIIKPEAPAVLATKLIEAMNIDSNDFLEDYTTEEFKQKAAQAIEQQSKAAQAKQQVEQRKQEADAALAEANVSYTNAQSKNTMDDNSKQLAVSIDKHFQEWADLTIKAVKGGAELPEHPGFDQVLMMARQIIQPQQEMAQQQPQQEII